MLEVSYSEFAASLPEFFARAKAGEDVVVVQAGERLTLSSLPQQKADRKRALDEFVTFCKEHKFGLSPEEVKESIAEGRKY